MIRAWQDDPDRPEQGSGPERGGGPQEGSPDASEPGTHSHGDPGHGTAHAHDHDHAHYHGPDGASESPAIGIAGAGAVGTALGLALSKAGWPVVAVASRDRGRRERFRQFMPDAAAFESAAALLDEADLIILAVPDDAIREVAAELRLYGGQALVHTSGVLGPEVLEPARAAGSRLGAFHPLVAFTADVERSAAALAGATVAVDGDEALIGLLADMAEALGAVPVRLIPGGRPAYHAAAVLAAGGFVALLDAIAELGSAAGLDEPGSLAVYGRLIEQTLGNARAVGIATALTGPIARGDRGTVDAHLAALRAHAPAALELYIAAARREVALARERGSLSPEQAAEVLGSLAKKG